jgi:hypothetical protein
MVYRFSSLWKRVLLVGGLLLISCASKEKSNPALEMVAHLQEHFNQSFSVDSMHLIILYELGCGSCEASLLSLNDYMQTHSPILSGLLISSMPDSGLVFKRFPNLKTFRWIAARTDSEVSIFDNRFLPTVLLYKPDIGWNYFQGAVLFPHVLNKE